MSTNQLRFQELNKLTLKGDYETNLFKIAKSLNISPYNKQKKVLIDLIIEAENKFKFKQTSCCICTEDFEPLFKPLEPCGHYIHESCIVNSGKQECPLCRVSVKLSDKNIELLEEKHEQFRREEREEYEGSLRRQYDSEITISSIEIQTIISFLENNEFRRGEIYYNPSRNIFIFSS